MSYGSFTVRFFIIWPEFIRLPNESFADTVVICNHEELLNVRQWSGSLPAAKHRIGGD